MGKNTSTQTVKRKVTVANKYDLSIARVNRDIIMWKEMKI